MNSGEDGMLHVHKYDKCASLIVAFVHVHVCSRATVIKEIEQLVG